MSADVPESASVPEAGKTGKKTAVDAEDSAIEEEELSIDTAVKSMKSAVTAALRDAPDRTILSEAHGVGYSDLCFAAEAVALLRTLSQTTHWRSEVAKYIEEYLVELTDWLNEDSSNTSPDTDTAGYPGSISMTYSSVMMVSAIEALSVCLFLVYCILFEIEIEVTRLMFSCFVRLYLFCVGRERGHCLFLEVTWS